MPLLDVNDLTTYFHTRNGVVRAVDGVSFQLEKGETLGIVGESGSGKSVTAMGLMRLNNYAGSRIISGSARMRQSAGAIVDLAAADQEQMRNIRGSNISMIFQ